MKKPWILAVSVAVCAGTVAVAQTGTAAGPKRGPERGRVVSSERIARLSADETAAYLSGQHYPSPAPRNGVDAYRIGYRTVDENGGPTTASGLLVLPRNADRHPRLVAYEHGTMAAREDGPSVDDNDARASTVLFAGRGYAAVAPDLLGLGTGPGHHPYMDAATEASASLDMLRAARNFAAGHGRTLDGRVLVTGFSAGGHAAMAVGRTLQDHADRHFALAAVAPVSGPFDVEHAEIPAALRDDTLDPKEAVFYLGYWITSMNRLHHLYDSPSEAFLPPYDDTAESLFDGDHSDEEVFRGLPDTVDQLLTPRFRRQLLHPTGALRRAMRENDTTCSDWTPEVPVRLYAADGDRDVAIANSEHCRAQLAANGVAAPLTDVGDVGHFDSPVLSMPRIAEWFEQLRPAR
ncbi:dienelactone hydrolase family protein [Streptomyces sp. NPDC050560]|uniref:dienelactone hydrolase family protein n=1 Tax=Streptomyces sp. NPDC050560 TaxID=3365630 RepID=UPI0037988BBD